MATCDGARASIGWARQLTLIKQKKGSVISHRALFVWNDQIGITTVVARPKCRPRIAGSFGRC